MINFNDDGQWEQNQDDLIEYLGNKDDDFEIVIDDEKIEPNWDILTTTNKAIEDFDLEKLTERMILKFECEQALLEEFENNCEKIK